MPDSPADNAAAVIVPVVPHPVSTDIESIQVQTAQNADTASMPDSPADKAAAVIVPVVFQTVTADIEPPQAQTAEHADVTLSSTTVSAAVVLPDAHKDKVSGTGPTLLHERVKVDGRVQLEQRDAKTKPRTKAKLKSKPKSTALSDRKQYANRRNAKKSTGPKTEQGKKHSSLNALKHGLFAKYIVIPAVDGEGAEEQFAKITSDLRREYKPVGPTEEHCVEEMARSLWGSRRMVSFEKGSMLQLLDPWRRMGPENGVQLSKNARKELSILQEAREEARIAEVFSHAVVTLVHSVLDEAGQKTLIEFWRRRGEMAQEGEKIGPEELKISDQFLAFLEEQIQSKESTVKALTDVGNEQVKNYRLTCALPSETDMDKIVRFEKRNQIMFDRARDLLLKSQERRKHGLKPSTS
jgi:hypothetical protein